MLACADISLLRQIQLTLEWLVETSINSPVSELALYKQKLYSPNKVSIALSIRPYAALIFWVLLCLNPSHQKPFVDSQQTETHNSFPFYPFFLCSQIPLHSW